MINNFYDIPEKEQKEILRKYLKKYKNMKYRIAALEKRKRVIERNSISLQSPSCDRDPVQGNGSSPGAAAMTYRCSEIESEITKAKSEAERVIEEIYKVIKLLSSDSVERTIVEYRYIDCMSWNKIYPVMNYSKSRCHDYENAGLTLLLTFAKVQEIVLFDYKQELEEKERLRKLGKEIIENKKHRTQSDT